MYLFIFPFWTAILFLLSFIASLTLFKWKFPFHVDRHERTKKNGINKWRKSISILQHVGFVRLRPSRCLWNRHVLRFILRTNARLINLNNWIDLFALVRHIITINPINALLSVFHSRTDFRPINWIARIYIETHYISCYKPIEFLFCMFYGGRIQTCMVY